TPAGKTSSPASSVPAYGVSTSSRPISSSPTAAVVSPPAATAGAGRRRSSRPATGPASGSGSRNGRNAAVVATGDSPRTCWRYRARKKPTLACAAAAIVTTARPVTRPGERSTAGGTSGAGLTASTAANPASAATAAIRQVATGAVAQPRSPAVTRA